MMTNFELTRKLLPAIWDVLKEHDNCAMNVSSMGSNIFVNILHGNTWKRFTNHNADDLLIEIKAAFL